MYINLFHAIQDNPLLLWTRHIDIYVHELLRLEGRADAIYQPACAGCTAIVFDSASYRCKDCFDLRLFCMDCTRNRHLALPFHQIEVCCGLMSDHKALYILIFHSFCQKWNGKSFEKSWLKSLGVRIQLGHPLLSQCASPYPAFNDDFTIIDSDGIHPVGLDYCGCQQTVLPILQLLRARLFPSTTIDPKTAATIRVLETFQILSFSSKISAFEYYRSLSRRTDNTGTEPPPVC